MLEDVLCDMGCKLHPCHCIMNKVINGIAVGGNAGERMHALMARLYPIFRSITGEGVRETLAIIGERVPLRISEVPTGTPVLDWNVPREWNIRDAYVKNAAGKRVIDLRQHTLHVLNYSVPVHARMSLDELRPHLHTLPDQPDLIPYRTSYYKDAWGFCLSHNDLLNLQAGEYEVCIDSTLEAGALTYGECVLQGESDHEVLISCHVCHPSLVNDNLSGIAVATELAQRLTTQPRRYTYRFVFIPGTIGSITWLAQHEANVPKVKHGLVLTCVGDAGAFTYKRSRRGDAMIDRAVSHVLAQSGYMHRVIDFIPYGYDERQYCSPGFNMPVGCFMRSQHGTFPEYHTSADDLAFVQPDMLAQSLEVLWSVIDVIERDGVYVNLSPKAEPQLGKRGLYEGVNASADRRYYELALLWVLNQSDGQHSLLDIAERASMPFSLIARAADALVKANLLQRSAAA
jgi:aminopeptidase-like protein